MFPRQRHSARSGMFHIVIDDGAKCVQNPKKFGIVDYLHQIHL